MRILWLARAEADLAELFDYLLDRDPQAGLRIYNAIRQQVESLAEHPGMGRVGRVEDTRELVINRTPHIIVYTVERRLDAVIVLRVLHRARSWPTDFTEE